MFYKNRSEQQEWLDQEIGSIDEHEYADCLKQLDRIGRFLGGDRATFAHLAKKRKKKPCSIMEVGCGGGFFTLRLAEKFKDATVTGIDLSEQAISLAKRELANRPDLQNRVHFERKNFFDIEKLRVDLIIATLTCHHFDDRKMIEFLKRSNQFASQGILINDLHRHPIATACFFLIAPLFFRNRLIFHDGLISIRRGFVQSDWETYLHFANIPRERVEINRYLPFRWIVWIQKD